ncbi:pentapeptide repeat-containing protein [Micromonospora cremea]|uniref:pentapeptide repeat-containing protein n=1 Tax=Micromonospora cremea TaxID=709881 RepID=UPI001AD8234A|nr:pentapeptide repeat-containing protein [Micromonospora cremea]
MLLVAAGLFYTNDANRKQQQVAIQGQVAERFSTGIDQLGQEGNNKLSIRLGGIYALERLMRDSSADEPTVIEVLCAFVRTHAAPWPVEGRPERVASSTPDVLAAIVVLARRPSPKAEGNRRLDLSGTLLGLDNAHLVDADLSGAVLTGASLSRANLTGADLSDTSLSTADLSYALLDHADLVDANLNYSDLSGAQLNGATMGGATMGGADLTAAQLDGADLREADLGGADLREADLSDADLRDTHLGNAHFNGADLGDADLSGAKLLGADLRDADLRGAYLRDADLRDADLRGVNLSDVFGLTTEQLIDANLDAKTRLPSGVARPTSVRTR